jgi:hypothetical protein
LASEKGKLKNEDCLLNNNNGHVLCLFLTYSLHCEEIEIFGPRKTLTNFFR